jgi:hypothetical protein
MNTNIPNIRKFTRVALLATIAAAYPRPALGAGTTAGNPNSGAAEVRKTETKPAEPKSQESKATESTIQSEVEKSAAAKRAQLLKDAQAALEETNQAIQALDQGRKDEALAALEKVTGKLDLIIARDPALAFAPVSVSTIVRDLYAGPDTAREAVMKAKAALDDGRVQEARGLLSALASEAEVQVTNIPLGTYPAAIKAVVPLIDAGKTADAKAALSAALNTLVIESYVTPLPNLRAKVILADAEKLAEKSARTAEENKKLHDQVEAARNELKLGEVLGYGTTDDYKPLYAQLDDIQKKTEGGKSGTGFFDQIKDSLKRFTAHLASQTKGS